MAASSVLPPGSVAVCMGGRAIDCTHCERDAATGRFMHTEAAAAGAQSAAAPVPVSAPVPVHQRPGAWSLRRM